ncbi:MAG: DUF4363 family protein [Eubacteriales bacterium]
MFKKILIIALFLGTITFAVLQHVYIKNTSDVFLSYCKEAIMYVNADDFDSAKEKMELINEQWEKSEKTLEALIEHTEIDNIERSLRLAASYLESEEKSMFLSEAQVLTFLFGHIEYIDNIALENIL